MFKPRKENLRPWQGGKKSSLDYCLAPQNITQGYIFTTNSCSFPTVCHTQGCRLHHCPPITVGQDNLPILKFAYVCSVCRHRPPLTAHRHWNSSDRLRGVTLSILLIPSQDASGSRRVPLPNHRCLRHHQVGFFSVLNVSTIYTESL